MNLWYSRERGGAWAIYGHPNLGIPSKCSLSPPPLLNAQNTDPWTGLLLAWWEKNAKKFPNLTECDGPPVPQVLGNLCDCRASLLPLPSWHLLLTKTPASPSSLADIIFTKINVA